MAASEIFDLVAAMCRQPRLSLELIRFCRKIFLLVLCGSLRELYQHELSAWKITANSLNLKSTSVKPIHSTDIDITFLHIVISTSVVI